MDEGLPFQTVFLAKTSSRGGAVLTRPRTRQPFPLFASIQCWGDCTIMNTDNSLDRLTLAAAIFITLKMNALAHRLVRKYLSVAEAEKENMVSDPRLGCQPLPFGFNNNEWRELLSKMEKGDELWAFTTGDESWDNLCGRSGIALVRNCKEIFCLITEMN